jgi:hypothetical protein
MKSKGKPVPKRNQLAKRQDTHAKVTSKATAMKSAPKKPRIGVLIVDDHSVVREGLASLIGRKADMTVLGEASNGR